MEYIDTIYVIWVNVGAVAHVSNRWKSSLRSYGLLLLPVLKHRILGVVLRGGGGDCNPAL